GDEERDHGAAPATDEVADSHEEGGEPGQQNGGTQVVHGRFLGRNLGQRLRAQTGFGIPPEMLGQAWPVARGPSSRHPAALDPVGGGGMEGDGAMQNGHGRPRRRRPKSPPPPRRSAPSPRPPPAAPNATARRQSGRRSRSQAAAAASSIRSVTG